MRLTKCTCRSVGILDFVPNPKPRPPIVTKHAYHGPAEGIGTRADSHSSLAAGSGRIRPLRAPPERLAAWGCMGCAAGSHEAVHLRRLRLFLLSLVALVG